MMSVFQMFIGLTILASTAAALAAGYFMIRRAFYSRVLRKRLSTMQEIINELERRSNVISAVASDYYLSLGKDGVNGLTAIRREIQEVSGKCRYVSRMLNKDSWAALHTAEHVLDELYEGTQLNKKSTLTGRRWEQYVELLIQRLGRKIVDAASQTAVPTGKFRQRALKNFERLETAGIAAICAVA